MTVNISTMDADEDNKVTPRHLVFSKMEKLVYAMQSSNTGVPLRSQKLFLTSINCAFTGFDLILWLLKYLNISDNYEALRLANFLYHFGYFFPAVDNKNSSSIKEDGTLYRFQAPYYWPSHNINPDNTNYAIHLMKRSLRNKQKHGLDEYEQEALKKLQKMLCDKWEFIHLQAIEQIRLSKTKKSSDKMIQDCQEKFFWRLHRPPPGHVNFTDESPKHNFTPSQMVKRSKNVDLCRQKINCLKKALHTPKIQSLKAIESLISRCQLYFDQDPLLTSTVPSNPWLSDDVLFWELNSNDSSHVTEARIKRWTFDFNELLKDPLGQAEFEQFLLKEYSNENLHFWTACEKLKFCRQSKLSEQVDWIMKEFLKSGAPREINIDAETLEKVNLSSQNFHRYMFELPQSHIYNLMKKDSYTRFLRSSQYKDLLATASALPFGKKKLFNFGSSRKKTSPHIRRRRNSISNDGNVTSPTSSVTGHHSYSTSNLRELQDKARAFSDKTSPTKAIVFKGSPQRETLKVPGIPVIDHKRNSVNRTEDEKLAIKVPSSNSSPALI